MYSVGIDIGSVTTKGVLFDGSNYLSLYKPTGFDPTTIGDSILEDLCIRYSIDKNQISTVVGTGYGRIHLPFADEVTSEITCQGRGCNYLFPDVKAILDVGGQDSKAMLVNDQGKVRDFVLNDKCAAGTGRFLEMSVQALGISLKNLDDLAKDAHPVEIGSMCSVFCETEVLNLMMQGEEKGNIAAGLLKSIANRVATMAKKVGAKRELVFTGGIAKSHVLRTFLQEAGNFQIYTINEPMITAALGAAIIGHENT
ncbi:acyl-CoA dehydratase activase [Natranaerobius thermophilus]|uniref:CoA-substrate-specific enzyme activase n=1 Tax=Natranaerobius thermophilus (strain ATCC BAA-1301 / DSM 18059 / JW/NM-WN-LF) TaxID=457570 RepID=B2A7W6_NATTJ|nr:acyl-CoA dehydratase activase [Natranaerobius thermophilus]ACB84414.1 CoA-substrate-specific enzyme activase [Natranaerobius thermophilus JW/NM-WN-LF]